MGSIWRNELLWFCLGASLTLIVTRGVIQDLYQVRKETQIKHEENNERIISQGTEDALRLETLQKLSESSNFDLRSAALRIVAERSTKSSTRDLLLQDVASRDRRRRIRAVNALYFLVSNRSLNRITITGRFCDLATFNALLDCLCHFLNEHIEETTQIESPILPKTRPPGEAKAMSVLNILLPESIPTALEAGVVSRWLSRYPFPCLHAPPNADYPRRDVAWLSRNYWSDDPVMGSIIYALECHPEGSKQLRRYGLMGSAITEGTRDDYRDEDDEEDEEDEDEEDEEDDEDDEDDDEDDDEEEDDDEDDDEMVELEANGEWTVNENPGLGRRAQVNDLDEQALRRRRREAMVLSEGGHPFGSENIIRPRYSM